MPRPLVTAPNIIGQRAPKRSTSLPAVTASSMGKIENVAASRPTAKGLAPSLSAYSDSTICAADTLMPLSVLKA
jgi:hypothetical protein